MKRDIKVSILKPNGSYILFSSVQVNCKLYPLHFFLPRLNWKISASANGVRAKIFFI